MPADPRAARTRCSSSATSRSASSHETSTKGSLPRRVRSRSFSHERRTAGRRTRKGEYTMLGMACSMGEGAGSPAKGSQRTKRPSSTTAVYAPQWDNC